MNYLILTVKMQGIKKVDLEVETKSTHHISILVINF